VSVESSCTANGHRVLSATVVRSIRSVWYADLQVDTQSAPAAGDAVTILFTGESGSVSLAGTAVFAGAFLDVTHVRVAGGKGKLATELAAKWYVDAPASIVLADVVQETGEALSPLVSKDVLDHVLQPGFARPKGAASWTLDLVASEVGGTWRVLESGLVFVGTDAFPDAGLKVFDLIAHAPEDRRLDLATDTPSLGPGVSFQGRPIVHVIDVVESARVRTTVYYE
jgi:hypothetical protein